MTPSGIDSATCRFVAWCLNHYATARISLYLLTQKVKNGKHSKTTLCRTAAWKLLRERWHDPMPQYFMIITLLLKCTKLVKHTTNKCLNLPSWSLTQSSGPSEGRDTPIRRHCRVNSTLFPLVPYWNMWPATHLASPPPCICSAWYTELCTSLLLWKSGSCPLQSLSLCSIIQSSVPHHNFPGNTVNRGACVNRVEGYMCELFRIIQGSVLAYYKQLLSTYEGVSRW